MRTTPPITANHHQSQTAHYLGRGALRRRGLARRGPVPAARRRAGSGPGESRRGRSESLRPALRPVAALKRGLARRRCRAASMRAGGTTVSGAAVRCLSESRQEPPSPQPQPPQPPPAQPRVNSDSLELSTPRRAPSLRLLSNVLFCCWQRARSDVRLISEILLECPTWWRRP